MSLIYTRRYYLPTARRRVFFRKSKLIDKMIETFEELKALAYCCVSEEVLHVFTPTELAEMKDQFFKISKQQNAREELAKQFKSLFEGDNNEESITDFLSDLDLSNVGEIGIKTLKAEFKALRAKIDKGSEMVKKDLWGVDDQERGKMIFYDKNCKEIYSRPLTQQERQTIIKNISKIS